MFSFAMQTAQALQFSLTLGFDRGGLAVKRGWRAAVPIEEEVSRGRIEGWRRQVFCVVIDRHATVTHRSLIS
jgi:hypothetical protein